MVSNVDVAEGWSAGLVGVDHVLERRYDGPLARVMEGYHYRPQQSEMAQAVTKALERKRNLAEGF